MVRPSVLGAAAILLACVACGWLSLVSGSVGSSWLAPLGQDHPLVGKIWDVEARRLILPEELVQGLVGRCYILLGEKHDNPDHHRIQAWIISGLVAGGLEPAVAFEMFRPDQRQAIETARATHPGDADHLAAAVGWDRTGWPSFPIYRPVIEAVLEAALEIRAANLSPNELRGLHERGIDALDPAFTKRFALDRPLPDAPRATLEDDIRRAHCGHGSESMINAMVLIQRARDARMAESLLASSGAKGVVLIAGSGHARRDYGVPAYLALEASEELISSVAMVEVRDGSEDAPAYVEGSRDKVFDFLWFTPRVDDIDPCEKYRKHLERMRKSE
jgi:uncharacterized iron-regulated protein